MSATVQFGAGGQSTPGERVLRFDQGGSGTGATQWISGRRLARFLAREPQLMALFSTTTESLTVLG